MAFSSDVDQVAARRSSCSRAARAAAIGSGLWACLVPVRALGVSGNWLGILSSSPSGPGLAVGRDRLAAVLGAWGWAVVAHSVREEAQ